jgi:outer membrane receptor protein involved in Fe transport
MRKAHFILGFTALVLWVCPLSAQTTQLKVRLLDESRAAIPQGHVAITDDRGTARAGKTDTSGEAAFSFLEGGTYKIVCTAKGFATTQSALVIEVGQAARVDYLMKVASETQAIQVVDSGTLVNTDNPAVGAVVNRRLIENLPLNGRNFNALFQLAPGVQLVRADAGAPGQFSVNGQRPESNMILVDGVSANVGINPSNNLGQSAAGGLPPQNTSGGSSNLVTIDALEEFRIETSNFAPEFGRAPGGQINVRTRSGSNEYRGTLFYYLRNEKLDANNWFSNSLGLPRSPMRQNNFGGVFGGPIRRDRTFFFASAESLRLREPVTAITEVPSLTSRASAPEARRPYLNLFPLPNGPESRLANGTLTGFAQFSAAFSNPQDTHSYSLRLDHWFSERFRVFGRWNLSPSSSIGRGPAALTSITNTELETHTLTLGGTWLFNSRWTGESRWNSSVTRASLRYGADGFGGATLPSIEQLLLPGFNENNGFFLMQINGGSRAAIFRYGRNVDNRQNQSQLVQSFSYTNGAHVIKFGGDYRRLSPDFGPREYWHQVTFNTMQQLIAGVGNAVTITSNVPTQFRFGSYGFFAQDTWRVTRRLTTTFGLRWDLAKAPKPLSGPGLFRAQNFDNPAQFNLTLGPGIKQFDADWRTFAPRLGASYQLRERRGRELVLRAGWGLFYDLGMPNVGSTVGDPPLGAARILRNVPYPLSAQNAAPPVASTSPPFDSFLALDPQIRNPLSQQWNIAFEQALGNYQSVTATFVGSNNSRLWLQERLSAINSNFPGITTFVRDEARSNYRALQLQFRRTVAKGLQFNSHYTWGKALDEGSSSNLRLLLVPGTTLRQEYGPADFDIRHGFITAASWFPSWKWLRGWQLNPIFRMQSAPPLNITTQITADGTNFSLRPDLVAGVPLYLSDPNLAGGQRINFNAFAQPFGTATTIPLSQLRQGTLGRNALRGFGFASTDLSFQRRFEISERFRLELRTDVFNLFNNPAFASPSGSLRSAQFGLSQQTLNNGLGGSSGANPLYQVGGSRSIQVALRLNF